MHRIISWYNQNRRRVWTAILAIFIAALVWYAVIQISNERTDNEEGNISTTQTSKIDTNDLNSITMQGQKSVISGDNITTTQKEISILDSFVEFCNNGRIQEAYNLLSDECKEEMYPNLKYFNESYYKKIFGNGNRNVTTENWIGNTYKVDFHEDALSTGRYSTDSTIQDYITIVKASDGNNKLNINNYLGRTKLDKTITNSNIDIKIVSRDSYMDYEYYTFEIKNNSDKAIALGDIDDLEATYLSDKNNLKYNAYMNEMTQNKLVVEPQQSTTLKIKYFNQYSSTREIKKLTFLFLKFNQIKT